jgi:hypothetical protein
LIGLLWFVLATLISPFRSNAGLQAENDSLRQQLIVLRRKCRGRVLLTNTDRWFFVQLYRWFPSPQGPPYHSTGDDPAMAAGGLPKRLALEVSEEGAPAESMRACGR